MEKVKLLSLMEIKKELDSYGILKYIKLNRKTQLHYYDYKNYTVVLRYNITTDTIDYISFTRKENK